MIHSVAEVEERLRHSLHSFASEVPDNPPTPWPNLLWRPPRRVIRCMDLWGRPPPSC